MKLTIRRYDEHKFLLEAGDSNIPYAMLDEGFFRECALPIPSGDNVFYEIRNLRPGQALMVWLCMEECPEEHEHKVPKQHLKAMSVLMRYINEHPDDVDKLLAGIPDLPEILKPQAS